ncbi:MAG: trehalose-6-phosphate synthase [Candidatus Andersenbacteria bacterium]|nr:trehalose-6-phosphate synthase [Candidatus Andersenbacteria bacterium]
MSNRLGVRIERNGSGNYECKPGAGGLATALLPLLQKRGGTWIGFAGVHDDDDEGFAHLLAEERAFSYVPVLPPRQLYDDYYKGYANRWLWPLCHSLRTYAEYQMQEHWQAYVAMNERFAGEVAARAEEHDLIWIHDYHLMLVPRMLRQHGMRQRIGFFLHIPFPQPDVFMMGEAEHGRRIIDSLLAVDVIGFQEPRSRDNFLLAVRRGREVTVSPNAGNPGGRVVAVGDHKCFAGVFPIGVDVMQLMLDAETRLVKQPPLTAPEVEMLIVAVDRLDYTKAVPERLDGYRLFLERHPEWHKRVALVQVLDLSRGDIPAYGAELNRVKRLVTDINGQASGDWVPVQLSCQRWERSHLAQLYQQARVGLITPRCDGQNLCAKEFVAMAPDDGRLVLGIGTGASWQLGEDALLVDGGSPEFVAAVLCQALNMENSEARARMARMKLCVSGQNVHWWGEQFIRALRDGS